MIGLILIYFNDASRTKFGFLFSHVCVQDILINLVHMTC